MSFGASMLGFNFRTGHPCSISPWRASLIHTCNVRRVGVFDRQPAADLLRIMQDARLDYAQVRDTDAPLVAQALGARNLIIELRVQSGESLCHVQSRIDAWAGSCAFILLKVSNDLLPLVSGLHFSCSWILSATFNAESLGALPLGCRPTGIELDAGIESAPGLKDATKALRAIVAAGRC